MHPRTCPVLSPTQGLGQLSRIQPMSTLCMFHGDFTQEPSHGHWFTCSYPKMCLGTILKCQLMESFPPEFSSFFPCLWSLCILASQEDYCTTESRRCLQPALAFVSQSVNPEEEREGLAGKDGEPSSQQEARDLGRIMSEEGFLPKPKEISPSWKEGSNERCAPWRGDLPTASWHCSQGTSPERWLCVASGDQDCGQPQKGACAQHKAGRWQKAGCILKGPRRQGAWQVPGAWGVMTRESSF